MDSRLPSLMEETRASPSSGEAGSRLPSLGGTGEQYTPTIAEPEPIAPTEDDYGWGITTAFKRGFERLRSLPDVAQGDYEELAGHFQRLDELQMSPHDRERMETLQNTDGMWSQFGYLIKNPALVSQVVAESLPMSVAPLATGTVGGLAGSMVAPGPGTVAGTMGGAAAGSYATEYLNSVGEYFGRQQINTSDPNELRRAFSDDELMTDARQFAHDRGVPIAVFDALSFGLAGRLYKPASSLAKAATGRTLGAGAVTEIGAQAGAGMLGEAGAQLRSVGEIEDTAGVLLEGVGEIVPGAIESAANAALRTRSVETEGDALSQQLDQDVTAEEEAAILAELEVEPITAEPKDALARQAEGAQTAQTADPVPTAIEFEAGAKVAERQSEAWLEAESTREAVIQRHLREMEAQAEISRGEAAAEVAPYMAPETASDASGAPLVSAEPMPGTSLGDALRDAGVATPGVSTESEADTATTPLEDTETVTLETDIEAAAAEAQTSPTNELPEPTEAQKAAGNYRKGHARIAGLDVSIENPQGSTRRDVTLKDHYGYIKRTEGADGDHVDVFVSPEVKQTDRVWVIDQVQEDGVTFDEHKVMLGYANQLDAVRGYKRNYGKDWKVGPVTEMSLPEFKTWLVQDTTKPINDPKPSRLGRKFIRTQKGHLRYSLPRAKKAMSSDLKEVAPGVDTSIVEQMLTTPTGDRVDTAPANALVEQVLRLQNLEKTSSVQMTAAVGKQHLKSFQASIPNAKIEVHESFKTFENKNVKQQMLKDKRSNVRGVFDVDTGTVHIFADQHASAKEITQTALHETVAHGGLRALFGDGLNTFLDGMHNNLAGSTQKRVNKIASRYGLDLKDRQDQRTAIEEAIAELAESDPKSNVVQRAIASVRKLLRKLGVVEEWTDNDIIALLADARSAIAEGKPVSKVKLKEQVEVQETGEIFDIETDAEIVLRQHDKRVNVIAKLKDCL